LAVEGPEPFLPLSKGQVKAISNELTRQTWTKKWTAHSGCLQTKNFPFLNWGKKNVGQNDIKLCILSLFLALQAEQSGNTLKNRSKKPFGPILGTFKYLQHYKNVITSPPLRGFTSVSLFVH
jgi:hypothetical protein